MNLTLNNLSVAYGSAPVLSGLNALVGEGEFIGLVGPNGSGKSCLLKTIAGLLKPKVGGVILDDDNIHTL